jgi:hypothetical protein
MAFDYERAKEKESEILNSVSEFLLSNSVSKKEAGELSKLILTKGIFVSPPEKEEYLMEFIMLKPSGRGGGRSRKPGNIKLNISKVIDGVANGAFVITGAIQVPILIPMAFIILWRSMINTTEVELSENDAGIIWAMWVNRDRGKNTISNIRLLQIVNIHFKKYSRTPITQKDLDSSLDNLIKIRSIKKSKASVDNWWLCEYIRISYK